MGTESEPNLVTFKCCDGGVKNCDWEVTAANEDLMLFQIEQHALNQHNLVFDENRKEKIRAAIKPR